MTSQTANLPKHFDYLNKTRANRCVNHPLEIMLSEGLIGLLVVRSELRGRSWKGRTEGRCKKRDGEGGKTVKGTV